MVLLYGLVRSANKKTKKSTKSGRLCKKRKNPLSPWTVKKTCTHEYSIPKITSTYKTKYKAMLTWMNFIKGLFSDAFVFTQNAGNCA